MRHRGQSIIEYVILLAIVAMAVAGMRMYMLRAVKAKFKVMQDELSGTYKDREVKPKDYVDP